VVLTIQLTAGINASQCDIQVEPYRVSVGEVGKAPVVTGELMHMIRTDDSTWTIDLCDGVATLHLDKVDKTNWWVSVFKGEPEIDITRVEPDHSKLEQEKMKKIAEFKKAHPELDFSAARFG